MKTVFRSLSLLALASAALSAHAVDTYSSLDPAPDSYRNDFGYTVAGNDQLAFQFVATETGVLSGFQLAMNNALEAGRTGYTLQLYSNGPGNKLGSVLGTYSGMSTGEIATDTRSALSTVAATGPTVAIQSGTAYWLLVQSPSPLALNLANAGRQSYYYRPFGGQGGYGDTFSAAFSVQVDPITSAVPGPAAALAFGVGLIRRRKRA